MLKRFSLFGSLCLAVLLTGCAAKAPTLGINDGKFKPCPDRPNCVNSQSMNEEHKISSIKANSVLTEAKLAVMGAIERLDGQVVEVRNDYIKAEFVSSLFEFVDDIEFYFVEEEESTRIEVRSASRVGYSDLGVNRARVEEVREMVETIVQ